MKTNRNRTIAFCLCALCMGFASLTSCGASPEGKAGAAANAVAEEEGNAVIETLMARRSIRKYKDQPVEREKLETIVECGIHAPSGMNRQPWQVRVVDNADYIEGLTEVFKKANPAAAAEEGFKNLFRNAPAVIFIGSPSDGSGQFDCGLLGQNMVLAAQSLGLGTCFLGGPVRFMLDNAEAAPFVERLQFPDGYALLYAIAVGYPDESPAAKPRDASKAKFVE